MAFGPQIACVRLCRVLVVERVSARGVARSRWRAPAEGCADVHGCRRVLVDVCGAR